MKEFPDRFRVINAGDGARGVDTCIVQLATNVRNENTQGLYGDKDTIVVQVISNPQNRIFCNVGQYWSISKDATYEQV